MKQTILFIIWSYVYYHYFILVNFHNIFINSNLPYMHTLTTYTISCLSRNSYIQNLSYFKLSFLYFSQHTPPYITLTNCYISDCDTDSQDSIHRTILNTRDAIASSRFRSLRDSVASDLLKPWLRFLKEDLRSFIEFV